jgi:hypothetical protein
MAAMGYRMRYNMILIAHVWQREGDLIFSQLSLRNAGFGETTSPRKILLLHPARATPALGGAKKRLWRAASPPNLPHRCRLRKLSYTFRRAITL